MRKRRVVLVCYPQVELLDLAGPTNVFTAATRLLERGGYEVLLAGEREGPIETAGGVAVVAHRALAALRGPIDTLIVPGGSLEAVRDAAELAPLIRKLTSRARRTAAVCTGSFVLAGAGLLAGRRVVTHWAACAELQRRFPACRVEGDPIFIRDDPIWTSAGVTAGIDLALAMVEEDHGPELALEVARWLVVYLRRPGSQSQFSVPLRAQAAERDPLRALVAWISEHVRADLSVRALAAKVSMSERNFARAFVAETRVTPAVFVQNLRLEAARRALETTRRSVKEIAATSGFVNVETMHRAFRRAFGSTPLEYRARFSTKPPEPRS
jgi:transcriptional regulator GlxA family with amidase domain